MGAEYVGLDDMDRVPNDEVHPHGRRQVEDHLTLADQAVHHSLVGDRVDYEPKSGTSLQVSYVLESSGGQIVDNGYVVSAFN